MIEYNEEGVLYNGVFYTYEEFPSIITNNTFTHMEFSVYHINAIKYITKIKHDTLNEKLSYLNQMLKIQLWDERTTSYNTDAEYKEATNWCTSQLKKLIGDIRKKKYQKFFRLNKYRIYTKEV